MNGVASPRADEFIATDVAELIDGDADAFPEGAADAIRRLARFDLTTDELSMVAYALHFVNLEVDEPAPYSKSDEGRFGDLAERFEKANA